jgi:glycosyltransferase involved in cell wall biosynthesis
MNEPETDHATVCVPVCNGAAFVAETLAAIQKQTHRNFTALMSDDASDDGSADICRSFTTDPRFRLVVQPVRLGWIGNTNWLLANATGELVCVQPHDDLPEPDYLARLVACLPAEPECALAFTDIHVFGLLDQIEHQESIRGDAAERARTFIANHYDGTAFRGLIRRKALAAAGGLRTNAMDNFAADVTWLARIAQAGEFRRVPLPLYRKRRRAESVSLQWGLWSNETKAAAYVMHCRELLHDALTLKLTPPERDRIVHTTLRRVLAIQPRLPFDFLRSLPPEQQSAIINAVLEELPDSAAYSGMGFDALLAWLLAEPPADGSHA